MNKQPPSPLGDSSILIHFGNEIDLATNLRVHALDTRLRSHPLAGVVETVPAYGTLLVHYDPLVLSYAAVTEWLEPEMAIGRAPAGAPAPAMHLVGRLLLEKSSDLPFV